MKRICKFSVLMILLAVLNTGHAQLRKIPADVTEAFKTKYPDTKNAEWKDKLTSFAVSFEMEDDKYTAKFNNKGEWIQTEKEITEEALPADVKNGYDKSKYTAWKVKSVACIENKDNTVHYRLLVRKNDIEKKYLLFDKDGKLLRDAITI
jgi:Putative beta-lactamase-inhibitor-like, PepSY-like